MHALNALHEVPNSQEAEPERLDAKLTVSLAPEKAAQFGDQADDLAQCGRQRRKEGLFGCKPLSILRHPP